MDLQLLISALIVSGMGFWSATLAKRRGFSPYFWFIIGAVFGAFGMIALLILGKMKRKTATETPKRVMQLKDISLKENFWYYLDEQSEQKGPMSFLKLVESFDEKQLSLNSLVWSEGLSEWTCFDNLLQPKN